MNSGLFEYILSDSPEATQGIAESLADNLGTGDTILLTGDLGTGKTLFARSLIQKRLHAAGLFEDVPSPTFTLVQTYHDGLTEIWHADLYRLSNPFDVIELGLLDAFEDAICLVEWPDRLGEYAPSDALAVEITATNTDKRQIAFSFENSKWERILSPLREKART